MRADRLLNIMLVLQNHGKMTTKQLAHQLDVSPRTILRDMDVLSSSGIPVMSERGRSGGWKLMEHYRSRINGLKMEELKSLFIMPSEHLMRQLGVHADRLATREKLLASLPESARGEARHFMEKIVIDTDAWKPSSEGRGTLNIVHQAVWEEKKLSITYRKADGERSHRKICPLGLVAKGSTWYLVALNEEGEYRSFRVSRIEQVQSTEDRFSPPEHFSLADYWEKNKRQFVNKLPSIEIRVLAHASIVGRMTFSNRFVEIVGRRPEITSGHGSNEKWEAVTLRLHTEDEAIAYVLGFGEKMRLLEPEYLVDQIKWKAKKVIDMYEEYWR